MWNVDEAQMMLHPTIWLLSQPCSKTELDVQSTKAPFKKNKITMQNLVTVIINIRISYKSAFLTLTSSAVFSCFCLSQPSLRKYRWTLRPCFSNGIILVHMYLTKCHIKFLYFYYTEWYLFSNYHKSGLDAL